MFNRNNVSTDLRNKYRMMAQLKCPDKNINSFIYLFNLSGIVHLLNPCNVPDFVLNTNTPQLQVTVPAHLEAILLGKCGLQGASLEIGSVYNRYNIIQSMIEDRVVGNEAGINDLVHIPKSLE